MADVNACLSCKRDTLERGTTTARYAEGTYVPIRSIPAAQVAPGGLRAALMRSGDLNPFAGRGLVCSVYS
jgi:hypothetical protein